MVMLIEEILILLLVSVKIIVTIVNPNSETARVAIYLQKPSELGPRTWLAGTNCLDRFTAIYFRKREKLTRSPNIVLSSLANMTTPAAQIQEAFIKVMMEAISEVEPKHTHYQFRIITDYKPYFRTAMSQRDLLLADYYVITIDSIERLRNLMRNYVSGMLSWNPGARFLILYNNADNRNNETSTAHLIFEELLYNFNVHRVALMYATSAIKYSILLMDYYNVTSCRRLAVKTFATCEEGNFTPKSTVFLELQLQKLSNSIKLNNCTFYMCASVAAPFVEADCYNGLELRLIGFIKNYLKFNIEQTCGEESRGVEEKGGNWSGLLGRLNKQSCDFIVGGFYPDNDVIQSFWVSDTYLEDAYTWFVKLADPRPPWMALYVIFQNLTWLSCIGMLLLTCITWYLLVNFLPEPQHTREFSLVGINNLAVTICVSANERPICLASRIFFVLLALYGLTLASTYTSKLIAVFADPGYLHQIDSLQEVKAQGIPYGGHEENRDWFENEEDMWIFEDYNYTEDFEHSTVNLERVRWGDHVLLTSRMYILQNPLADNIYAFPDNVFSSPIQMIMKPGFPFMYEFNWLIRYVRDFGILEKIQSDFIYRNTYLNRIRKTRPTYLETEIVLTPQHLQGSFAILIVGASLSAILFFAELLTFYVVRPCWQKYADTKAHSNETFATKLNDKKEKTKTQKKERKRGKRHQKRKLSNPKTKMTSELADEIVISWNDRNIFDEVRKEKKAMRFTPFTRRIIENRENILKSAKDYDDDVIAYLN